MHFANRFPSLDEQGQRWIGLALRQPLPDPHCCYLSFWYRKVCHGRDEQARTSGKAGTPGEVYMPSTSAL